MRHDAQGFEQFVLSKAYLIEGEVFVENVKLIFCSDVDSHLNVASSHVLSKVKQKDDGGLKRKTIIALHGNKDDRKICLLRTVLIALRLISEICRPFCLFLLENIQSQCKKSIFAHR